MGAFEHSNGISYSCWKTPQEICVLEMSLAQKLDGLISLYMNLSPDTGYIPLILNIFPFVAASFLKCFPWTLKRTTLSHHWYLTANVSFFERPSLNYPPKVTILVTLLHYIVLVFSILLTTIYLFSNYFLSIYSWSFTIEGSEDKATAK